MEFQQFMELIYLETPEIALTVKGHLTDTVRQKSHLSIDCEEVIHFRTAGQSIGKNNSVPPLFFCNQPYEIIAQPLQKGQLMLRLDGSAAENTIVQAGHNGSLSGLIRFDRGGETKLSFLIDGAVRLVVEIEVFPNRLCYRADYEALAADAAGELRTMASAVLEKSVVSAVDMEQIFRQTISERYPLERLEELYGFWCLMKFSGLFLTKYRLNNQNVISVTGSGVKLNPADEYGLTFENAENAETLTLTYQTKDAAACGAILRASMQEKGSTFVFLPRYSGAQNADYRCLQQLRNEIAAHLHASREDEDLCGAYLLFAGEDGSEELGTIGTLPFLPAQMEAVEELLNGRLLPVSGIVLDEPMLPWAIEQQLACADWSKRDVLVGCFRNKDQFETCLAACFYYIPYDLLEEAGKTVRTVALMQTHRFFQEKAGVEYYGTVTKISIVPRKAIREVPMRNPSQAEKRYYRFTVRSWQRLRRPIVIHDDGFIHTLTTKFLLKNMQELSELQLQSEEEYRLYQELKCRIQAPAINVRFESSGFQVGEWKILMTDGWIQAIHGDEEPRECRMEAFARRPYPSFRDLMGT